MVVVEPSGWLQVHRHFCFSSDRIPCQSLGENEMIPLLPYLALSLRLPPHSILALCLPGMSRTKSGSAVVAGSVVVVVGASVVVVVVVVGFSVVVVVQGASWYLRLQNTRLYTIKSHISITSL